MTTACTLSDGKTPNPVYVEFKDLNVTISHSFNNPVLTVDTPVDAKSSVLGSNTMAINIGFTRNDINLSFTLKDGPGTYNFGTPSTNYEKIMYLANYVKNAKTLTLGTQKFYCHITAVNIPWVAGMKNLTTQGNISLILTANLVMGDVPA